MLKDRSQVKFLQLDLAVFQYVIISGTSHLKSLIMSDGSPTKELLEAVHSFPCEFRFKVIGVASDHFVGRTLAAVCSVLGEGIEPAFSTRTTSGGRHMSITVEQEMESADQVLEVYAQLRELEGLVMLM